MRFLIVDTCYPAFLAAHYAASPGLDRRPYAEQWQALMATSFGTGDAYSHYLSELGHPVHPPEFLGVRPARHRVALSTPARENVAAR